MEKEIVKRNKLKFCFAVIVSVIIAGIIIFSMYTIHINNIIDKLISDHNSFQLHYNLNLLILSKNNVNKLNKLEEFSIVRNNLEYTVNNVDNFNWFNIHSVNSKYKSSSGKYYGYKISVRDNQIGEKIKVQLPNKLKDKTFVDIYINKNGEYVIYNKAVIVENKKVNIDIQKGISDYIITYVPLMEISLKNENISINKTLTQALEYEIYPEDATEPTIDCIAESDIVTIQDNSIKANAVGNTKVNLVSGNVSKEINIEVNEIVSEITLDKEEVILNAGESVKLTATTKPDNAVNDELVWESSNEEIVSINDGVLTLKKEGYAIITISTKEAPIVSKEIVVSSYKIYKEPERENIQGLTYIDGILVVNKKYSLPQDYNPGLKPLAIEAYNDMIKAANKQGVYLKVVSDFRTYSTQKYLYNYYVGQFGVGYASIMSAQAGHSEHQTGLALDVSTESLLNQSFGDTFEGKWLAKKLF